MVIPKDAFKKNLDGSYSVIKPVVIQDTNGSSISMNPGMSFSRGVQFMGIDIAKILDEENEE